MIRITPVILWSFVPIFHSESNQIEIFQQREERHQKKRNESGKQRDEDHHASKPIHDNP
jgi:hypothetical protein